MATIVNNPPASDTGSGAGWAVAAIVLLLVLLIGYFGFARFGTHSSTSNINVTLPSGGGAAGGSAGGGAGGGGSGGTGGSQ